MKTMIMLTAIGMLTMAGCQNEKVAHAPEPPPDNVVTKYVANGVTAMNKAQTVADQANAQEQQHFHDAENAGEPSQ